MPGPPEASRPAAESGDPEPAGAAARGNGSGGPPGRLAANLMHFARTLRAAGLPVGSGAVLDALRSVEAVGLARRDDFYWTLHAVFVRRADQRPLFDEAFHVFWRNPRLLERVTSLLLPTVHTRRAAMQGPSAEAQRSALRGTQGEAPDEGTGEKRSSSMPP